MKINTITGNGFFLMPKTTKKSKKIKHNKTNNIMKTQKVILVTGASKGFGLEIAKTALAAGDKVIATVRSKADQLAASLNNNPNLLVVTMDVTNEAQVKAAV